MRDYERSRIYRGENGKRAGRWYFDYWLRGQRRQVVIPAGAVTERAAERWAADYLTKQRDSGDRGPRLRDYAEGWFQPGSTWVVRREISEPWARSRRYFLKNHILPKWGDYRLMDLDPVMIEEGLLELGLAGTTLNKIRGTLVIMVKEARRARLIPTNPLAEIERLPEHEREHSVFTPEEICALFPEGLAPWQPVMYGAMGYAMYSSGMRSQEIHALAPAAVRPGGVLVLRAVKNTGLIGPTKNEDTRSTLVTDRGLDYLRRQHGTEDLLFPAYWANREGLARSQTRFRYAFTRAIEKANIDIGDRWLTPHSLRHTWRTEMRRLELAGRIDAGSVNYMMGHKSAGISERYIHLRPEEALDVLQEYRPAINAALT